MMLHLAYVSPMPPARSGIADYSADLLEELSSRARVTVYNERPEDVVLDALEDVTIAGLEDLHSARWDHGMTVYQVGNSLFHEGICAAARRYPGIVVLHDYTLHHLVATSTVARGDFASYVRALAQELGTAGTELAWNIQRGAPTPVFEVPLTAGLVRRSVGILVHSTYALELVSRRHPRTLVSKIPQPIPMPLLVARTDLRSQLKLPQDAFVIITCGIRTPEKRLDLVAAAVDELQSRHDNVVWLKTGLRFGESTPLAYSGDSPPWIVDRGYLETVADLTAHLMASDVCVNLRDPTAGETSASCLRALACGTPVIVSDAGWYRELPALCCPRIIHDGKEVSQLRRLLETWYLNPARRTAAGIAARSYVANCCDPGAVAEAYLSFIELTLRCEV